MRNRGYDVPMRTGPPPLPSCVVFLLCLGCLAAPVDDAVDRSRCDSAHLAVCEQALREDRDKPEAPGSPGQAVAAWESYLAARRGRDPQDGWSRLSEAVQKAVAEHRPRAIVVADADSADSVRPAAAAAGLPVVTAAALPNPKVMAPDEALLMLGAAARLPLIVRVERGTQVRELFPQDPLRPFMAGVPAVVRDDGALARLTVDIRIADLVETALRHAGAFQYLEAAATAAQLVAVLDGEVGSRREPVLRGRYALQLLRNTALVLEKSEPASDRTPSPAVPVPVRPQDTPYGDLLRVRLAKSPSAEWSRRQTNILRAVAADRRDDLGELFSDRPRCQITRRPPPISGVRDLVFVASLSAALAPAGKDAGSPRSGTLPLPAWRQQYAALVRLVEATGTAWSYLPALLGERGATDGQLAREVPEYARVTALGLRHLQASQRLQQAEPLRYPVGAEWALLTSRGVSSDPTLRQALLTLVEQTVRGKLSPAATPAALLETVWTAVLVGISLPPGVRDAHFRGLFTRLGGLLAEPLQKQTGWTVALLYAIKEAHGQLTQESPALEAASEQVVRALDSADIAHPELARLLQATIRYLVLALRNPDLLAPADIGAPARFPALRSAAYDSLRAALLGLRPAAEAPPPPALVEEVATLIDALWAVTTASARAPSLRKPCSADSDEAGLRPPELQAALGKLRDLRARALATPLLRDGKSRWARRARLLTLLLSDGIDFALRDGKKVVLTADSDAAEGAFVNAIADFVGPVTAVPLGQVYGSGRQLLAAVLSGPTGKLSSTAEMKRLAGSVLAFLQVATGEAETPLLAALRGVDVATAIGATDEAQLLTGVAAQLFAQGRRDQAEVVLLAAATILGFRKEPLPPELERLAGTQRSQLLGLILLAQAAQGQPTRLSDHDALASVRAAAQLACLTADAELALDLTAALRRYREGKHKSARRALTAVLRQAQESGLRIPHLEARYQDLAGRRGIVGNIEQPLAAGLLLGGTFQLGLSWKSQPEVSSSMELRVFEPGGERGEKEAMRTFIQAAARLLIYDLHDGDVTAGEEVVGWLVAALRHGLRLGTQGDGGEQSLAQDSRGALAVAAQAAAESGLTAAAGALWSQLADDLDGEMTETTLNGYLQPPPAGLSGVPELDPLVQRAAASLRRLAPLISRCLVRSSAAAGPPATATCAETAPTLALHLADSRIPLPTLAAHEATRCPLVAAELRAWASKKGSDPGPLIAAAGQAMLDAGHPQEAALWLLHHRNRSACGAACVPLAQQLGKASLPVLLRNELQQLAGPGAGTPAKSSPSR